MNGGIRLSGRGRRNAISRAESRRASHLVSEAVAGVLLLSDQQVRYLRKAIAMATKLAATCAIEPMVAM
jgi:hypothetical protein